MAIDTRFQEIVRKGVVAATAAGPLGAFAGPFDASAIGGIWSTMLVAIAKKSGHNVDGRFATKFIGLVGAGAAAYYGGCKAATWLFHFIPGAGTLAAMGISTLMNALFTYRFGVAVARQFANEEFNLSNAAEAATSVLAVLCTYPSVREFRELADIV